MAATAMKMKQSTNSRISPGLDSDAAATAVAYLAKRAKWPTLFSIGKLLYLADKEHLSRYGRQIIGDYYTAMQLGPVPSAVYNSLKALRGDEVGDWEHKPLTARLRGLIEIRGKNVVPKAEPDLDWLSDSDIACLDFILDRYGSSSFEELKQVTHDKAWDETHRNAIMKLESIIMSLPNGETVRQHVWGEVEE